MGQTLMENRNGMIVQAELSHAARHVKRKAALKMINRHFPDATRCLTRGADKGYDSTDFIAAPRRMVVTPHVAQKTRHPGHDLSQRHRKKIEEPIGCGKAVGGIAQTIYCGPDRVRTQVTMPIAA